MKKLWRDLHAMDSELTPGCIYTEAYKKRPDDPQRFGSFEEGETTLVWRLQHEETAKRAAEVINQFFLGSGIHCMMEMSEHEGKRVPLVRSNMDKAQWSRLTLFCKYCFEEEIPQQEREALHQECQKTIETYLDTPNTAKSWNATAGLPAAIGLAGMHGILRPANKVGPDRRRKTHELNELGLSGIPNMFRGVPVHVDIDRNGALTNTTPYIMGHSPLRASLGRALDEEGGNGHTVGELVLKVLNEITGIDVISRHLSPTARGLHGGVLLSAIEAGFDGRLEPIKLILYAVAGGVVGITYDQARTQVSKWIYFGKKEELEAHPEQLESALKGHGFDPSKLEVTLMKDVPNAEMLAAKVFTPENQRKLQDLLHDVGAIRRAVQEVATSKVDDVLATRLYSGAAGLGF